ncbi:MAG: DNA polymerase I [Candidatus Omnitrophica bacterium]|nr:DNA polymerase I [Candidatus Omnitrophota bacterium]
MTTLRKKVYLIDGHALCYRSFYAIQELTTSSGQPTNAVFGFVNILRKILKDFKPEYLAICFDSKKKTQRQEKFADYKIQRPPTPEKLLEQIPIIKKVVGAFNIPSFELGGFEADDIIATLVKDAAKQGVESVIISDDKDMFQLVDDVVKVFSPRRDVLFGREEVKEKMGVYPDAIADYIGLAGDSSDNIPGVKGVGKVTAVNLLTEFGSLEKIYESVDQVKSEKLREKLLTQKDQAQLSKELAVLNTQVPFHLDLGQMKIEPPNKTELYEIFKTLEFRKFAEEFSVEDAVEHQPSKKIRIIELAGKNEILTLIGKCRDAGVAAVMLSGEDDQADVLFAKQLMISAGGEQIFNLSVERFELLAPLLEDAGVVKVTYDIKRFHRLCLTQGQRLKGECFDILLASYLLSPAQTVHTMDELVAKYLKISLDEKAKSASMTQAAFDLYLPLKRELEEKTLLKLFNTIEMPLAEVLADMEKEGICIDVDFLHDFSKSCEQKIGELQKKLYTIAGEEFNLNSPKQLSQILFEKLKLPAGKKTKTGLSTDEEVLLKLAKDHEFPALILEYRQIAKLKSTYIDALPKLVNSVTGRVHGEFFQTGTETGRFSSRNPNLQNIPIRTELGREIRKAFIPSDKNRILVAADYSQIELRILAHLSHDEELTRSFKEGLDIHQRTAALMFGVKEDQVTKDMRYSAKRVNFGIVYGMSAYGLARDLNVSFKEAQDFIDRYFVTYPRVKEYMDATIKECEEKGYVVTLLNRRRYIPEINNTNNSIRQFAQRQAINTPVQGSAADLIKMAMVQIFYELNKKKLSSKMILTVHDELVFDTVKSEKEELTKMVTELMENPLKLSVPIVVTVKSGHNWAEMY